MKEIIESLPDYKSAPRPAMRFDGIRFDHAIIAHLPEIQQQNIIRAAAEPEPIKVPAPFHDHAIKVIENGWSIYPQTIDRRPAKISNSVDRKSSKNDRKFVLNWQRDYDLTNTITRIEDAKRWSMDAAFCNLGAVMGPATGLVAIDIDCTNEDLSAGIQRIALEIFGFTGFQRVGMAPKIVFLYRQEAGAERFKSSKIVIAGDFEEGKQEVEIQSNGKTITIVGIHHQTLEPFRWVSSLNPLEHSPSIAPVITQEQLDNFTAAIDSKYGIKKPEKREWTNSETGYDGFEAHGLKLPKTLPDGVEFDAFGMIVDGRSSYMRSLGWQAVLKNKIDVQEADDNGQIKQICQFLADNVVSFFLETAETSDRWSGENLKAEAVGSVGSAIDKLLSGKMNSDFKSKDDQKPLEVKAEKSPAEVQRHLNAVEKSDRINEEACNKKFSDTVARENRNFGVKNEVPEVAASDEMADDLFRSYTSLGHCDGKYFFITRSGELRQFTSSDLNSPSRLIEIESSDILMERFAGSKGINGLRAAETLICECLKVGRFSSSRIRGRGLWSEGETSVLHMGNKLIVNGKETDIRAHKSEHVYSLADTLKVNFGEPLSIEESETFIKLLQEIAWKNNKKGTGLLFAGWMVTAAICGGLDWRTHAYITGENGQGKGWLINNIVKQSLGQMAKAFKSKTTEAAIRRSLGCDALTVILDEFETQTAEDLRAKQAVLDLARAASEEDGTAIVKASSEGDGVRSFSIRSSFLFASINLSVSQAADESRIIVFEIVKPSDKKAEEEGYARCAAFYEKIMTEDFSSKFLGRSLANLSEIRKGAKVFKMALVSMMKTSRMGDTWGTPMAGAWSLTHDVAPTLEQAKAFIIENGWNTHTEQAEVVPEWRRALDHIIQQSIYIKGGNGVDEYRIGALVSKLAGYANEGSGVSEELARNALGDFGIKVEGSYKTAKVLIANGSLDITSRFDRTDWRGSAWKNTISRSPTAAKMDKTVRFGSLASRCTSIDFAVFSGD